MKCVICEDMLGYEYTNLHNEVSCLLCGATYNLEEGKPVCNIKSEFIALLRKHWNEANEHSGIGGDLFGPLDKYKENKERFDKWLNSENEVVK